MALRFTFGKPLISNVMQINKNILMAAVFLIEQEHGNVLGEYELNAIKESGLNGLALDEIINSIKNFINSNLSSKEELFNTAIFVLGKKHDPELKGFFITILKNTIDSNIEAAYQTMIALDNLNEPILNDSCSITEHELNYKLGKQYLEKINA